MKRAISSFRPSVWIGATSVTIMCLVWLVCIFSARTLQQIERQADDVTATRELQQARNAGLLAMIDQETGVRGYVATGNPLFLDIYRNGSRRYAASLQSLTAPALAAHGVSQLYHGRIVQAAFIEQYFVSEIVLTRSGRSKTAVRDLAHGKGLFDRFRALDGDMADALAAETDRERAGLSGSLARLVRWLWDVGAAVLGLAAILGLSLVASARIERQAGSDPLTRVANRRTFDERLRRLGEDAGVVLIDLNDFKLVNDRFGHAAGDALLSAVATRLAASVRHGDLVARLGGDEFAVVFDSLDGGAAAAVLRRVEEAFERPFEIEGGPAMACSASFGVAEVSPHVRSDDVVSAADRRMYEDKRRRRTLAGDGTFAS